MLDKATIILSIAAILIVVAMIVVVVQHKPCTQWSEQPSMCWVCLNRDDAGTCTKGDLVKCLVKTCVSDN